jgi:hypothetical protein
MIALIAVRGPSCRFGGCSAASMPTKEEADVGVDEELGSGERSPPAHPL